MDHQNRPVTDLFGSLKSWLPWRSEPPNISRDFWMPDHSCRVCYECDCEFTIFNRRHHCRLCGRIFCGKCTTNTVPVPHDGQPNLTEERERIRVCNFCFKQREQRIATNVDHGVDDSEINSSNCSSADSFVSSGSSETAFCSTVSLFPRPYPLGHCDDMSENTSLSPYKSAAMDFGQVGDSRKNSCSGADMEDQSGNKLEVNANRIDYGDDNFSAYQFDPNQKSTSWNSSYCNPTDIEAFQYARISQSVCSEAECDRKNICGSPLKYSYSSCQNSFPVEMETEKEKYHDLGYEHETPSAFCAAEDVETQPIDFENNGLLWLPPEPDKDEDEIEAILFDDDDYGETVGEWGSWHSSGSFGSGDYGCKENSAEDQKKAVKFVVDGHFRALVSQLLQVENLPLDENDAGENWLEIVTSLSWEAATVLKPDTSRGGGMDPGGYVKVKCIASGRRSQSTVIRGVVCKKNVAHRRMTGIVEKPRVMILGGALEYQRVSNLLSSVDTLLKQEMDHLKMAVTKIDAHNPDVLLVEKSVSRFAQDYILEKDIALVLNIKRPLLERIARCTGAQIVPSIDHLSSQMLGNCDSFYVEKHLETHGSAGQGGKKLTKTLMYFDGCPKPLGCTILLRGANGDELKKVKHVVKYGIFAAYHLALETSFLADEGASLPEVSPNGPITVALPNESLSMNRSISFVPGFTNAHSNESFHRVSDHCSFNGDFTSSCTFPSESSPQNTALEKTLSFPVEGFIQHIESTTIVLEPSEKNLMSDEYIAKDSSIATLNTNKNTRGFSNDSFISLVADGRLPPEAEDNGITSTHTSISSEALVSSEQPPTEKDGKLSQGVPGISKEDFVHASSDHQRIVVSLSSRCVWKGTVCERSHLFRIKYYGSSDKPLGRFLQDHLFDQSFRCRSCEMPSEAHVHCYTHQQGTLTISVKQLPEILLPGEGEGKIWMWHRCLRCPKNNGFPPATRRVVMSDAAWGLSFGKFLELSFSNHAAASRVASCGHSLHRDCLRFYGSGKMVACFRYASIDVHSVCLPPSTLDFNYQIQDWIQKEADEIVVRAEVLFSGVLSTLRQIAAKKSGGGSVRPGSKIPESRMHIAELEDVLHIEKAEFEDTVRKCLKRDAKEGQPAIDILEMNRLRRQLLFQSYMWDHRLVYASSLDDNCSPSFGRNEESEGKMLEKTNNLMSRNLPRPVKLIVNGHDPLPPLYSGRSTGSVKQEARANDSFSSNQPFKDQRDSLDLTYPRGQQGSISSYEHMSEQEVDSMEMPTPVRRTLSDSQFSFLTNLSDTLDAAWIGERQPSPGIPKENNLLLSGAGSIDSSLAAVVSKWGLNSQGADHLSSDGLKVTSSFSPAFSGKSNHSDSVEDNVNWLGMPFINFYRSLNKNFHGSTEKLDTVSGYNPVYLSSFRELELQSGAQLLLPVGFDDTVIPIYDDEPTSIICYALVSEEYHMQLSDEGYRPRDIIESAVSLPLPDASSLQSFHSADETFLRSSGSIDESMLSMSGSTLSVDPLVHPKSLHVRVSFSDNGPNDKVKYTVYCYYAKQFEALRKICCPCEVDFVRSLSRCKKWGAQGGKSNVFFAKTLDDRFIIKQVTKTELESFIKFAPGYFKYLTEAIGNKSPTALAKVLGIYQVVTKHLKGGKDSKMDVLVMENLLFGRKVTRLYDLKGSSRSRYNPDVSGSNKVLLDQNLIEAMPTSPIFVGNKAKRSLERAVWNDTSFLASVDVMDYSLLVGVDEEKHELVLGIIDFMRQYTWDKHLETWVKASGILGGPKNASPTVISPKQYKIRFRKAMTTYFLIIPDQWSPGVTNPSQLSTKLREEYHPVSISPSLDSPVIINPSMEREDSPVTDLSRSKTELGEENCQAGNTAKEQ